MAGSTGFGVDWKAPGGTHARKCTMLSSWLVVNSAWCTCGVQCKLPTLLGRSLLAICCAALSVLRLRSPAGPGAS
eukprot:7368080-Lingulodinium_polyedra.AAC.1